MMQEDPEPNNMFWVIMLAMSLVVFIIELFIMFYLIL